MLLDQLVQPLLQGSIVTLQVFFGTLLFSLPLAIITASVQNMGNKVINLVFKGFVMIELDNVLNIAGATFTFTDKGEGTLPFEFHAHQASLEDQEYAPCRIVFFDQAA